jgi:predicted ester cyclase
METLESVITGAGEIRDQNKAIVREFFAAVDNQDFGKLNELLSDDFVLKSPVLAQTWTKEDVFKDIVKYYTAFPDWKHSIEELVAEGDKVTVQVLQRGTHTASYEGIEPTGTEVTKPGVHIISLTDCRIREWWGLEEELGFMLQLGMELKRIPHSPEGKDHADPVVRQEKGMSVEEKNKAIIKKYADEQGKGNLDFIHEIVDPDFVYHYPNGQDLKGLDNLKAAITEYQIGFPDGKHEIVCQLAEADLVATSYIMTGTHTGDYMGIPPTKKQFKLTVIDICRLKDGKIVEAWVEFDPSVFPRISDI